MGVFSLIWEKDVSKLSVVIVVLFCITFIGACLKLKDLPKSISYVYDRENFKIHLLSRIKFIKQAATAMVTIGLIGTVVGFIYALEGIDSTSASNADDIGPMVGNLIQGMGIAFYTTLVGAVFALWSTYIYNFIERVSTRFYLNPYTSKF